ncbi:MAG TPA: hypothetical protein VNJ03_06750 [Vicinamibacterales bacterium]|nr:hypothetical protein [Vicinamibacterales bacterium]
MSNHDFEGHAMRPIRSIDDSIDATVRDLMHVDPRPGLRRRVLSTLDAPVRKGSWMPWLLAPAGALAAVLLAVALLDNSTHAPVPVTGVMTSGITAPSAVAVRRPAVKPARTRDTPAQSPKRGPVATPASIFGQRSDRVSAASVRFRSNEVRPADMGEPAASPDTAHGALMAPSALVIPALDIQPLHLPALSPRR